METINHIVSGCEKLVPREYKRRHGNVAKMLHWKLREKYGSESNERWYEHEPQSVVENDGVKLLWDVNIQCDHIIAARRPDIKVINKQEKSCLIIDIAIPGDVRVHEKEEAKIQKYQELNREIKCLWKLRKVQIVPVVVGALGSVTKRQVLQTQFLQKTALLGTEKGVGYLKEGERIPLGHLIVGYEPIPWEIKRHKISL